jgi:2-oxo-4-hydroxy-4-carboxy-5-ureidoimidazoline decarboxylase
LGKGLRRNMEKGMAERPVKPYDPAPSAMSRAAFVARFGGVYEHFPQIAERAWDRGLSEAEDTAGGLAAAMASIAVALDEEEKLALIRNHPDLAGKAAVAGELTAASKSEQADAGLDQCTPEEFARFQELNAAYRAKFGFPFILAVGGRGRREILAAFEARVENDRDTELRTALQQIDRIARLRLDMLAGEAPG